MRTRAFVLLCALVAAPAWAQQAGTINGQLIPIQIADGRYIDGTGTILGSVIFSPDGTYDIGASGATRPRHLYLSGNAVIGGNLSLTGSVVSNLLFSADNAHDIGASGATRPRYIYPGTAILLPDGTAAAPSLAFASYPTTGFSLSAANQIGLNTSGTARFNFANAVMAIYGSTARIQLGDAADVIIGRETAAILKLGLDAAGTTDQMIKGPDRITSDGVGGKVTVAGGRNRGASLGGSVCLDTSPVAGAGNPGVLQDRLCVDATGLSNFGATYGPQLNSGSAAPTVASCSVGTAGAVTAHSSNTAGEVTPGTGSTSCAVVFGAPNFTNQPFCIVTPEAATVTSYVSAISVSGFTVSALAAGEKFMYTCFGGI